MAKSFFPNRVAIKINCKDFNFIQTWSNPVFATKLHEYLAKKYMFDSLKDSFVISSSTELADILGDISHFIRNHPFATKTP